MSSSSSVYLIVPKGKHDINYFFPVFFVWLQVLFIHSSHHNDNQGALFQLHTWTFPVVMKGQHWLKREHKSWMPWHTGRGQSKMEKKKPCPRLLDYLVVVGARWELNLTLRSRRNSSINIVIRVAVNIALKTKLYWCYLRKAIKHL